MAVTLTLNPHPNPNPNLTLTLTLTLNRLQMDAAYRGSNDDDTATDELEGGG